MKKIILIALSVMLFIGCDDTTKEVETTTPKATTETKDIHTEAVIDAKKVVEALNKKVVQTNNEVKKAITPVATVSRGATLFKKCATCHGKDGKKSAFEKSEIIAGQDAKALIKSITDYQAGNRNVAGMGKLMSGQVRGTSREDIKALAEYISTL